MIELDNCLSVSINILKICSKRTVVSFAAHKISAEFEIQTIAQLLYQNAVEFALAVDFANHKQSRHLIWRTQILCNLSSQGICRLGRSPAHHLHHAASLLLDTAIWYLPGIMDLEGFAERNSQITLESFDELLLSCGAEDGGKNVVEARHLAALLRVG